MTAPLDFYFDFSSPYGYFAAQRIDELAARYGRETVWHPVLLGVIFKATGGQPLMSTPLKREYCIRDWERIAQSTGVAFTLPATFPVAAHVQSRAFLFAHRRDAHRAKALARALYRAYFVEGRDTSDPAVVVDVCVAQGFDRTDVEAALQDPSIKDGVRDGVASAQARGVFGSPFIIVDDEPFWGWDRLPMVEATLARSATSVPPHRNYRDMVDEAYAQVRTLSVEEARAKHACPDVQFVDVRDVRELEREGAIPGAFHAPRGMLEFWIDPSSPYHKPMFGEDKEFVFFCAAGWRSALAAKTAQDLGLARVSHIDGGFGAWKTAGAPVEPRHKTA